METGKEKKKSSLTPRFPAWGMLITPSVFVARQNGPLALLAGQSGPRNCLYWSLKHGAEFHCCCYSWRSLLRRLLLFPHIAHGYNKTVPTSLTPRALCPLPPTAVPWSQLRHGAGTTVPTWHACTCTMKSRELTPCGGVLHQWEMAANGEVILLFSPDELFEDRVASYDLPDDVRWHRVISLSSSCGKLSNTLPHTCSPLLCSASLLAPLRLPSLRKYYHVSLCCMICDLRDWG